MVQETTNATGEAALTVLPTSSLALTLTPQAGSLYATTSTTVSPRSGTTSGSVVLGEPLSITSASSVGMIVGAASAFMVTTQGYPMPALTEGGKLPPGLTFIDNKNGTATLKGTPIGSSKTYTLTIKAANGFTTVTQSLAVTVGKEPTITSAASATFVAGKAGIFAVKSSGFPVSVLLESGPLPPGRTFRAKCERNGNACGYADLNRHAGQLPVVHKRRQCRGHCYSSLHTDTHTAPGILKRLSYDIYWWGTRLRSNPPLRVTRMRHYLRRARYLGA